MLRFKPIFRFCQINTLKSRISGSAQDPLYDKYRSFYNQSIDQLDPIPGITIVKSQNDAAKALQVLMKYGDRPHAWDTETIDIDLKNESMHGQGKIICCSCFCGPEVNFGNGPRLFIDNFAQNSDLIQIFKEYLEDRNKLKIWHNYSFDRQMFYNHGINVQGFAADTMHMARLQDPSKPPNQYGLGALSDHFSEQLDQLKKQMVEQLIVQNQEEENCLNVFKEQFMKEHVKTNLTKLFGTYKKLKDGSQSAVKVYPSIIQMHTLPQYLPQWINYSTLDAEVTFFMYFLLNTFLEQDFVRQDGQRNQFGMKTMRDIYNYYWRPFGELLTDMERQGMEIDIEHMNKIKLQAENEMKQLEERFLNWVQSTQQDDMSQFNMSSQQQLQQLLFAPCKKVKQKQDYDQQSMDDDSGYFSDGRKKPVRKEVDELPEIKEFQIENKKGIIEGNRKAPLKYTKMKIKGLGIKPEVYTSSGFPSTDMPVLKNLCSNDPDRNILKYLPKEQGLQAQEALQGLVEYRQIETLLGTFIISLINLVDKNNRIHTSLNINTETGRLSSRNPNLLNQPALDKDRYKIRQAFRAQKGNKIIVADYGQLELRVLAHMTSCQTMIDAFLKGGDFHSRTAITMYPQIEEAIKKGEVLLEWDKSQGEAKIPLVKDCYANERKKAKTMNFSIAYGKTASGFARDWKCSLEEAQRTIDAWFNQRKEVKQWQERVQEIAQKEYYTKTLLGRKRNTSKYFKREKKDSYYMHGLRAAINTPIQGGAADIVIASMVKLYQNEELKKLGWKLVLQIHDELIVEGPEESCGKAFEIVKECMENPFKSKLLLPLEVDAKLGDNWYECK